MSADRRRAGPGAWARSILFEAWLYASLAALGLLFAPIAIASRAGAVWAMKLYCRQALGALRLICGVAVEIRGAVPRDACVVAAKHQSFLDVLVLMRVLPRPKFVMKRSLVWTPVLGLYALRIGAAPIDRAAGGRAVRSMARRLAAQADERGQVVIYPQGTRVPPGIAAPYRRGVARLADALALDVVPVATNAGCFWGRRALLKRPGVAVITFLEPIEDVRGRKLMAELERRIEQTSGALSDEARGGVAPISGKARR